MFAWLKKIRPAHSKPRDMRPELPELQDPAVFELEEDLGDEAEFRSGFGLRQPRESIADAAKLSPNLASVSPVSKPAGHPPWLAAGAAITLLVISGSWIVMGAFKQPASGTKAVSKPVNQLPPASTAAASKSDAKFTSRLTEAQPRASRSTSASAVQQQVATVTSNADGAGSGAGVQKQRPAAEIINTPGPNSANAPVAEHRPAATVVPARPTLRHPASRTSMASSALSALPAPRSSAAAPPPRRPDPANRPAANVSCLAGCVEEGHSEVVYSGEIVSLASQPDTNAQAGGDASDAVGASISQILCAAGCYSGPRNYLTSIRPLQTPQEVEASREGGGSITVRRGVKERKQGVN